MNEINKGMLWLGKEWKEAIILTIESMKKSKDIQIIGLYKDKNMNKLLDFEKVFIGYGFISWDNHKTYKTKIPIKYNEFIKKQLKGV